MTADGVSDEPLDLEVWRVPTGLRWSPLAFLAVGVIGTIVTLNGGDPALLVPYGAFVVVGLVLRQVVRVRVILDDEHLVIQGVNRRHRVAYEQIASVGTDATGAVWYRQREGQRARLPLLVAGAAGGRDRGEEIVAALQHRLDRSAS